MRWGASQFPLGMDPAPVREQARRIWRERWLLLEQQIVGEPWLLRSGFCFTDVYLAVLSRWANQEEWRPVHVPRVEELARAVAARPVISPVWRRHFSKGRLKFRARCSHVAWPRAVHSCA